MRRACGYVFLAFVVAAGACALYGRVRGARTLNPLAAEGSPDWLGIGLIAAALVAGAVVMMRRDKKGNGNGTSAHE
jgi:hypothetical protein